MDVKAVRVKEGLTHSGWYGPSTQEAVCKFSSQVRAPTLVTSPSLTAATWCQHTTTTAELILPASGSGSDA